MTRCANVSECERSPDFSVDGAGRRYDDGCGSQSQGYRHTPGMKANRVASRGLRMLRGWLTSVSVRYLRYSWELMSTETISIANYVIYVM